MKLYPSVLGIAFSGGDRLDFLDKYQVFLLYIQWIRIETFAMDKAILLPLKLAL